MKGFTLIEIIIVLAIVVFLTGFVLSWGIDFYNKQQLSSTAQEVVQTLRRAQFSAMMQKEDKPFGVYFEEGQYRLEDEIFKVPGIISFSGLSEVVFSKLEGLPSNTGNVILSTGLEAKTININSAGRINLNE